LPTTEIQNLLIVGVDTASIANSAKKAGYKIHAADYFGDIDLRRVCSKCESIIQQKPGRSCGKFESKFKPGAFVQMTRKLLEKAEIDVVLLSSGLDDYFDVLKELNDLVPILGNNPEVIKRVREKPQFFEELKHLEIQHPETASVRDIKEAKTAAAEIGYPIVVKPSRGFGGANIRKARNSKELEQAFKYTSSSRHEVLIQKFIDGIHASASLIASNRAVETLTTNEQLIGLPHVFRFQGTLECVQNALGMNLVTAHINACVYNHLPTTGDPSNYCTRLILYAPARVFAPDLTSFAEVRDIPLPNTIIEKNEPLCSIIATGNSRWSSLRRAKKLAKRIYKMLRRA
jgi:predicted ATP-grasp superfamily ATP-dependent carboligase